MKGNVTSRGFIYLVKALCEIKNIDEVGRRIGLQLLNENDMADISIECSCDQYEVDTHYAIRPLERYAIRPLEQLIRLLSDSQRKEIHDEVLVMYILQSAACLNWLIERFESIGMSIDCDTFDGHLYNARSALLRALGYFCRIDIDSDDAKIYELIDEVSLNNYFEIAKDMTNKYHLTIQTEIKKILYDW